MHFFKVRCYWNTHTSSWIKTHLLEGIVSVTGLVLPHVNKYVLQQIWRILRSRDVPGCPDSCANLILMGSQEWISRRFLHYKNVTPHLTRFTHSFSNNTRWLHQDQFIHVTAQVRDLPRMGIPLPNSDYKTYTYNEIWSISRLCVLIQWDWLWKVCDHRIYLMHVYE